MKTFIVSGLVIIIIIGCRMALRKLASRGDAGVADLVKYHDALYPVEKAGKWGYMNNRLEMVIKPQFMRADNFQEGFAVVAIESDPGNSPSRFLFGFIDTSGRTIAAIKYHKVAGFSQGLAMVMKDEKYGYINEKGIEIIPLQYEDASSFSEGLAVVKTGGKNGYIDQ
ncbi:MAG: WG repeat-containing protein, partial [Sphingobacteriales bacterium]